MKSSAPAPVKVEIKVRIAGLVLLISLAWTGAAAAQSFQLPLDCRLGEACAVQNYADTDASAAARDPACGPLTYDGHDGLDFRVPAGAAVNALAPAAGVVRGARDGELDDAFRTAGRAALNGRDCGNGVSIIHEDGWVSQLCHFKRGSVRVRTGERVAAGQVVGVVGASGFAAFRHLHLTLWRNDVKMDPLTLAPLTSLSCGANPAAPGALWTPDARAQLAYRGAQWFAAGFTGGAPPQGANAEDLPANAARQAPAFVFWGLAIGPRQGDVLRVRLLGPDGALIAENTRTQPRDQAEAWVFAGRRTPSEGWRAGAYRGEALLERGGAVIARRVTQVTLR